MNVIRSWELKVKGHCSLLFQYTPLFPSFQECLGMVVGSLRLRISECVLQVCLLDLCQERAHRKHESEDSKSQMLNRRREGTKPGMVVHSWNPRAQED